jgi:DNA-binding IclR family transcriptional regulator
MDLVNSIVKAVRILDLLKVGGSLSYMDLLKQYPLPKSTLFKILSTLEAEELVRKDPESGRFKLGVKLIEWGSGARGQLEIRQIALPLMQQLSEALDCTVHLAVLSHGEVLPIESVVSASPAWHHYNFPGGVGIPAPLHATGAGKALLAFMKPEDVERTIRQKGLPKLTATTITDPRKLRSALAAIRKCGYAVSDGEHDDLVRSVAAPIRDTEGKVIASLSALGIVTRITKERVPEVSARVVKAAYEISRLCGHRP